MHGLMVLPMADISIYWWQRKIRAAFPHLFRISFSLKSTTCGWLCLAGVFIQRCEHCLLGCTARMPTRRAKNHVSNMQQQNVREEFFLFVFFGRNQVSRIRKSFGA